MKKSNNSSNGLYEVRHSRIHGTGVFARKRIRPGRRIIEYTGERISPKEEAKRYLEDSMNTHHTFLFTVDKKTTIDAGVGGNDARFINHSCQPNCETVDEDGHIFIEAVRNIQPGVELTYDYNFEVDEPITPELKNFYPCHCGSAKCRGTILKFKRKRRKKKGKRKAKSRR